MAIRLLLIAIVVYSVLAAVVFCFQRRLLYFPSTGNLAAKVRFAAGLKHWPESEINYRGFTSGASDIDFQGTVIVFHGNAGSAADRSYYIHALEPLGYRVLIVEYPGYGNREGNPSQTAFVDDAKETVRLVQQEFGGPIVVWGESLGCGVATAVASDSAMPIKGLALLTPWDSLTHLAQRIYWYLPVRWLLLDKFDNLSHIRQFNGPIAVVLAEQDEIIPVEHGLRLFDQISGRKKLWKFANAGHNSWPVEPNLVWWSEVMEFVFQSANDRQATNTKSKFEKPPGGSR